MTALKEVYLVLRQAQRIVKLLGRAPLTASRFAQMHSKATYQPIRKKSPGKPPRVFNLDLHISVIADLEVELNRRKIGLTRWSISGHNFVQRRVFTGPDPVRVVNAKTWNQLDENMIDRFQDVYGRYLLSFDGFIVTHTSSFSELFRGIDRPALVLASTRYEAPYTTDPAQWSRLNDYVRTEVTSGRMLLAANNRGDRDYCEHFLGITPRYVPSLCDYTQTFWTGSSGAKVVQSSDKDLTQRVIDESKGEWNDSKNVLMGGHSWDQVASIKEFFITPYNVSTMTLFELATAGVPVSVPSRRFLKELARECEKGALSQLTWNQVRGKNPPAGALNPNNSERKDFFDWWLDRADFYDSELMPNVRIIDSLRELIDTPHPATIRDQKEWLYITRERNTRIDDQRKSLISDFLQMMG